MKKGLLVLPLLLSAALYLALTVLLPWWRYGNRLNSWRQILAGLGQTPLPALLALVAGLAALYLAYFWGWRLVRTARAPRAARPLVWGGALLFAAILFWLLPITADLFVYLSQAHQLTDLGTHPFLRAAADLSDPLVAAFHIEYTDRPSVYGPAWTLLSAPGTAGRYDVPMGVAWLKALAAAAYLGCAWLLDRILRSARPEFALEGLYLFAWNPLVLLTAVGDGHNDVVMMAAVLLALGATLERRWVMAAAALAIAVWIKYVAVIFVPLLLWVALKRPASEEAERSGGAPLRPVTVRAGEKAEAGAAPRAPLMRALVTAALVSAVVLVPFGSPSWVLDAGGRLMRPANWQAASARLPSILFGLGLVAFAASYALVLGRLGRGAWSDQRLLNAAFVVALLAFVLGAARSQPWHLIWPAALAGLSDRRWAWPLVAGLSCLLLAAQLWVEWGTPGI